jgi:hypothetical protein
MLLFSKTLNKDINFATFEKENEFGRPIKVIFHDSLQEVIHNEAKVKYDFNFIVANADHTVVVCTMVDGSGRLIREVGEAVPATLDTEIARNYPSLIASQRAFDRAAIRYLDLPGKVFSNMEISIIDETMVEMDSDTVEEAPAQKSGIISSVVGEDDFMNLGDEIDVEEDVPAEVTDTETDASVDVVAEIDDVVADVDDVNIDGIGDVDAADALPFDVNDSEEADDCSGYVITMNGKYAGKNKTIAEIYATDASWIEWIAANFKPHNPVAEKDVAAIKKFVEAKKGA